MKKQQFQQRRRYEPQAPRPYSEPDWRHYLAEYKDKNSFPDEIALDAVIEGRREEEKKTKSTEIVDAIPIERLLSLKNTAIPVVRKWNVGMQKDYLLKLFFPVNFLQFVHGDEKETVANTRDNLLGRAVLEGLYRDNDMFADVEDEKHAGFARAMGQHHKAAEERVGVAAKGDASKSRRTDTADFRLIYRQQASCPQILKDFEREGFHLLRLSFFRRLRQKKDELTDPSNVKWVVSARFTHESRFPETQEAMQMAGIEMPVPSPTLMAAFEQMLLQQWLHCNCFSNSAHIDPTRTLNFEGKGFGEKHRVNLGIDAEDHCLKFTSVQDGR